MNGSHVLPCPICREITVRGQWSVKQEVAFYQTRPCWCLDLGLSASRTVKELISFGKPPRLWYFVLATLEN